jgi:hypothetical protein
MEKIKIKNKHFKLIFVYLNSIGLFIQICLCHLISLIKRKGYFLAIALKQKCVYLSRET